MKTLRHTVPPETAPQRLDRYLVSVVPDTSRSQIQKLLEERRVWVNGKPSKASHRVGAGEEIRIEIPPPVIPDLKPEPMPLDVLYEDPYFLIVDKPAGLVVHPAPGHPSGTLVNGLLARGNPLSSTAGPFKPGIVHRLDKDTSGILVVAKDDVTHRELSRQFAAREVRRIYLTVVQGVVRREEGTIDAPIGRHPVRRQRMAVWYGGGREATTRYRVLKRFSGATLLELHPQTGRTHQLRVHLAHLGHPILGDARYGGRADPSGAFSRQALHAHRLGFEHPRHRRWVEFASPLPPDLARSLKRLQHL